MLWDFRRLKIDQLGKSEDTTLQGNYKFMFLNFENIFIMEILKQVKREKVMTDYSAT